MYKRHVLESLVLAMGLIFGFGVLSCFADESITITTYYPSPYGSYNQLQTNSLGVGDNDGDDSLDSGDVPTTAGDVWIKGNLGIGTTSPDVPLHVIGPVNADAFRAFETQGAYAFVERGADNDGIVQFGGYNVATSSFTNTLIDGASLALQTRSGGNVGIGTTSPVGLLHVGSQSASPLYVASSTGNVGIGTTRPQSKLQVDGGYIQLDDGNTAAPAAADCDAAAEEGRMYWDATNDNCYICSGASGWRKIATVAP